LPGEFSWPTRIFQLDRCLLVQRFNHANGKELVVMNLHNSAYDSDGSLKKLQMDFLREKVMLEYEQGNYVIVGGDWNQCPPYFAFDTFKVGDTYGYTQINISPEFLPEDWRWVYDPTTATNRKINMPFDKEKSFTTLIDFFLISPNIQVKNVRCIKQDFQFSDHQPVWMEIELL
jgi:endonuclease/exonuclease/phosphatase family metal-dependent hydrolase